MSLKITCPVCGARDGYEFVFGGEERGPRPEETSLTPRKWCDYVHMRRNIGGVQAEWWFHRKGCGLWFSIQRDVLNNREVSSSGETV